MSEQAGGGLSDALVDSVASFLGEPNDDVAASAGLPATSSAPATAPSTGSAPSATDATAPAPAASPTPPADAPAPTDGTAPAASPPDALNGFAPLVYRDATGAEQTLDGVLVHGTDGAIVDAAALPALIERLAHASELETVRSEYDRLSKLASWTVKDEQGQDRTLAGPEALASMHTVTAVQAAALDTLLGVLTNPQALANLLQVTQDAQGNVTGFMSNKDAFDTLMARLENGRLKAERMAQQRVGTLFNAQPAPPPLPDFAREPQAALAEVEHYLRNNNLATLSPDDKQFLVSQFPRYIRRAEAADVKATPQFRLGQPIVDGAFLALAQRQAQNGTARATTAKTAAEVAKENAARLAAARGHAPATASAPAPTPEKKPDGRAAFFDRIHGAAATVLGGRNPP